ncbi:proto-oncogene Mas-like [Pituophis catenifer annectens]|uniref:proto-oncogene Mas-like n=1 Tax=Pituophis catenifer annectens TaxID=94852 RepID=UPI0039937D69
MVAQQLPQFLEETDFLDPYQFGFRCGHRMETALVALVNDLWRARDGGCSSILVLLDPSVAFDTINHDILLQRLGELGTILMAVTRGAFAQVHLVCQLRPFLDRDALCTVTHALVTSHLDYCNSLYMGLPLRCTRRLQLVQNAAVRVVMGAPHYSHVTPLLHELHWLLVVLQICFKVLILNMSLKAIFVQALYSYMNPMNIHYKSILEGNISSHIIENMNTSNIPEISSPDDQLFENLTRNLINGFFALVCLLGLVGNGRTIYLLAFSIKRNPFTTFILNLSIADFGVLTSLIIVIIFVSVFTLSHKTHVLNALFFLLFEFFFFTYSASQFLLTAISLDRCVAVLFPLWHRCHRPPNLSTLVCSFIWILSFLLSALHYILYQTESFGSSPLLYQLIVNGLLCMPLMVASTVTLMIHMRSKSQRNQRKLLITIFLALLFFFLFSLPMNALYVVYYFGFHHPVLLTIGIGCGTLNSSINPLLYFLVGRKKRGKGQHRASLKVALQRVFRDEQSSSEGQQTTKEEFL